MKLMRRRTNEPMTKTPFSTATVSPSTHKDNPRSSAAQRPPRRRPCNGRSGDRQPQSVGQGDLSVKAERTGGQPRPAAASTPAYRAAAACRGGMGGPFACRGSARTSSLPGRRRDGPRAPSSAAPSST